MDQGKLPGIQVARAVAALSIVYFHSWVALIRFSEGTSHPITILTNYGWLGVDLFFAISGFVIGVVASKATFEPISFLVKRAFRLYPLWLLTLTLFAGLAMLWRGPTERETISFFLYSATLLPTDGYPFYDLGWSLQHEIAFYALAAIAVPLFGLRGLAAALGLSSLICYLKIDAPWFIANFAMYHAEFLAGLLAFLCWPSLRKAGFLLPFLAGAGSLVFFFSVTGNRPCVPISLFCLIVAFANLPATKTVVAMAGIGNASYSIYLWHPLIFLVPGALTKFVQLPIWTEEPIRFGCVAVIILLSLVSWRYFESPIIDGGNSIARRTKARFAHV